MVISFLPVSLPSPSVLTNLKILEMGEFVCILTKAYQLKKEMTWKRYQKPLLSNREYEEYINSLEHIYGCISKENPVVTIITGDFDARSPLFWEHNVENNEGRVLTIF